MRIHFNLVGYQLIFVSLLLLTINADSNQVDSFNLLFPTSFHPTKGHARQIVTAAGGCYDWKSSQTDIIKVKGTNQGLKPSQSIIKNQDCESNGIVELVKQGPYPSSVQITAKGRGSGQQIIIPVRIRQMKRISILTKSKMMNIKQIQNLQVYGFDSENNTFTSLEGLRFRWFIYQINEKQSIGSVQKIPLADSSLYLPLDTRRKLEEQGSQSDIIVVKALKVGSVKVRVRCLEMNYEMIDDQIILYIQQKFQIYPGLPVSLLAGSKFKFSLKSPLGQLIPLPSTNYDIRLSNPLFQIDDVLQVRAPRRDSQTTLSIRDRRTQPAYTQSTQINSYQPDKIQILIPQQIIIGQSSSFDIKFYRNREELKGQLDSLLLSLKIVEQYNDQIDQKVFILDRVGKKVQGFSKGSGIFKVQYNGLFAEKKIHTITPLKLVSTDSKIILPVGQIYQVSIVGGSGSYKFINTQKSQQQAILSISFNGLITTRKEGLSIINVVDERNPNNKLQIQVYIVKIGNIYSLEQFRQFNLNQDGSIYISANPRSFRLINDAQSTKQHYTECNDALLRGLTFTPLNNSQSHQSPIKVITINPINYQTIRQIESQGEKNIYISRLLRERSVIGQQNIYKQYQIYTKYNQIKRSDLDRLVADMENFGLCAKVLVRAVVPFTGQVDIERHRDEGLDSAASNLKLRVYNNLINDINGLHPQAKDIIVAPLASFKWKTRGGPYRWDNQKVGNIQVYVNNIKIDPQRARSQQSYLYPIIACSSSQKSDTTYTLKYQNPVSQYLPRPVIQQKQINVHCRSPELLLIGLPLKRLQNREGEEEETTTNFQYFLSNQIHPPLYIYEGQCFRILLEPVLKDSVYSNINKQYTQYYNISNIKYQFKGVIYGDLQQIPLTIRPNDPKSWNTQMLKYQSRILQTRDSYQDHIMIKAYQLQSSIQYPKRLINPIIYYLTIKTVKPLRLSKQYRIINLPNIPSNQMKVYIADIDDPKRFSLQCDDSVVKCVKSANNQITIIPQNIGKTQFRTIRVTDQYAIGRPSFQIPIKVSYINGVDLRVGRVAAHDTYSFNKDNLQNSIWLLDGQEFLVYVDVYSYNSSLISQGLSPKEPIRDIDPNTVQIRLQKLYNEQIKQLERTYDTINNIIIIRYKLPKTFQKSQRQQKISHSVSASLKGRQLTSNVATLQIYDQISLLGFPIHSTSANNQQNNVIRQVLTLVHIMQSCQTVVQIVGGPAQLVTRIQTNRGQKQYYTITKLSQRKYRIQTIKSTPQLTIDPSLISITKRQKNLLSIIANTNRDSSQNPQISVINCLIFVLPIRNIRIDGLNSLLTGRRTRYLAQFGKHDVDDFGGKYRVLQDQCSLKYSWKANSIEGTQSQIVLLTSDKEKMGINVTAVLVQDQQQLKMVTNNPFTDLTVIIYNKQNRQITRATKRITVLSQQQFPILSVANPNRYKNPTITIKNTQLFLIPPRSGLQLSPNYIAEQLTPCSLQDPKLAIQRQNQIVTGQSNKNPQLIKLSYRQFGGSRQNLVLPIFLPVLVTDICGVVIDNIDGSIAINPSIEHNLETLSGTPENLHLVRFNLLDCLGRKFLHYNYKNLEYRIYVSSPIATAKLYSLQEGLISLQGHQIGQAQLTLQVILNGVLKAKDIMPVFVNIFIRPSKPLTVHIGDIITFKGPVATSQASSNKWMAADSKIIKINPRTGQAIASAQGQTYIQYGAMSTRVSVVKLVDIKEVDEKYIKSVEGLQTRFDNGYTYQPIYSGVVYGTNEDRQLVMQFLSWRCEILGKQGEHLRGIIRRFRLDNKQYIRCNVQKIAGTKTLQSPITTLKIRIVAENKMKGQKFARQFEQSLQVFIILSERYVNPRDPKIKKQKNKHQIVVQTNQRLDIIQKGGKEYWIIDTTFTGARQTINLDLSQYRGQQWRINLSNPRTKQSDYVLISYNPPANTEGCEDQFTAQYDRLKEVPKSGWKWTDILVFFMALNFLVLVGYQIWKSNNSFHSKTL